MADQSPLKVILDGSSNTCGLGQFAAADTVGVVNGGTGLATQGICAFAQPGINAVACKTTYIGICAGKSEGVADENTYVGYGAGQNVTTGCYHTIIGSNAGDAITTCSGSVLIGYNAGSAITFGDRNTAIGTSAGATIVAANDNTLVGYVAGCVTTGQNNTGLGACALGANTVGVDNVAIGTVAGKTQVAAGCNNTYIGSQAGPIALCRDNTLVGAYAGTAQTTATCNVMLGGCVGYGVVGGGGNVYLGYKSGLVNTSGNDNVFIGKSSGVASTASCCLIIGNATCDIITGSFNTPYISMISCVGIGTTAPGNVLDIITGTGTNSSGFHMGEVADEGGYLTSVVDHHLTIAGGSENVAGSEVARSTCASNIQFWQGGIIFHADTGLTDGNIFTPTQRMIITNAGNVGIGTATPSEKLHILGDDNSAPVGQLITQNGTDDATIQMHVAGGSGGGNYSMRVGGSGGDIGTCNWGIYDEDNSAVRMVIADGGEVGIGTTAPGNFLDITTGTGTNSSGFHMGEVENEGGYLTSIIDHHLTIAGGTEWVAGNEVARSTCASSIAFWAGDIDFYADTGLTDGSSFSATQRMTIQNDGLIGIGTTSPDGTLHVFTATAGSVSAPANADELIIENSTHAGISILTPNDVSGYINFGDPDDNDTGAIEYSHYTNSLIFYTNATTERMRINCAGNVSIGTATANAGSFGSGVRVLSIEGDTTADFGAIEMISTCAGTANRLGDLRFINMNGTGSLVAQAGIRVISDGAVDSTAMSFFTEVTGGSMTEKMRITSAGCVGIGTASPALPLVISGGAEHGLGINVTQQSVIGTDAHLWLGSASAVGNLAQIAFGYDNSQAYSTQPPAIIGYINTSATGFTHGDIFFATKSGTTNVAPTEAMRITSAGDVGIGTTTPGGQLDIITGATTNSEFHLGEVDNEGLYMSSFTDSDAGIGGGVESVGASWTARSTTASMVRQVSGEINFYTDASLTDGNTYTPTNRMMIDTSGDVGIGTIAPSTKLEVYGSVKLGNTGGSGMTLNVGAASYFDIKMGTSDAADSSQIRISGGGDIGNNRGAGIVIKGNEYSGATGVLYLEAGNVSGGEIQFNTGAAERMVIGDTGNVGIGTTAPVEELHIHCSAGQPTTMRITNATTGATTSDGLEITLNGAGVAGITLKENADMTFATYDTTRMTIDNGGAVDVVGAFSKGSGSFKIDHPLENKKDTHQLIHSFIEGPQADLMYRGIVQLVDGCAQINIDTVSDMTSGTFVALNRCTQVFTTNESNWDTVKGSITGNALTIESNVSTSAACISWMVIGERCDEHIMNTEWTDSDGKVIVEPEKDIVEP